MKTGRGYTNNAGTGQIDKLQRNAYLNSKGINPSTQFQLALLFPETLGSRDDLRHVPDDYAFVAFHRQIQESKTQDFDA
jgi:hypothetical protein